jgi:hypothetical protein
MRPALKSVLPHVLLSAAVLSQLPLSATPQTTRNSELSGTWEGQMLLGSNWRYVEARFGSQDDPSATRVDLPQERREFRDFVTSGDRLTWTLVRGTDRIEFEGTRTGDAIRGRAVQAGF